MATPVKAISVGVGLYKKIKLWAVVVVKVVSVLAFYSDDPSSNPAEVYNFSVILLLKRTKINKKRPGLANF